MGLKENLERRGTDTLYKIVKENDRTEWQEEAIEKAKEVLKERGVELPDQNAPKKPSSSTSSTSGEKWLHKVVSKPVLSNQKELQNKLNKLGRKGWRLIDTQRHSIAGKQHAVCFLRKEVNSEAEKQNEKLDEVNEQLSKLLELQKDILKSLER